mmetsp:Transcript_76963/g.238985  ORF Transcript_76963/g.238985 Transcript_76963/m.238985 type:complete len:208 (-) Transcript_76963:71-694(-)
MLSLVVHLGKHRVPLLRRRRWCRWFPLRCGCRCRLVLDFCRLGRCLLRRQHRRRRRWHLRGLLGRILVQLVHHVGGPARALASEHNARSTCSGHDDRVSKPSSPLWCCCFAEADGNTEDHARHHLAFRLLGENQLGVPEFKADDETYVLHKPVEQGRLLLLHHSLCCQVHILEEGAGLESSYYQLLDLQNEAVGLLLDRSWVDEECP